MLEGGVNGKLTGLPNTSMAASCSGLKPPDPAPRQDRGAQGLQNRKTT